MSGAGASALGERRDGRLRGALTAGAPALSSRTAERIALGGLALGMLASAATLLILNSGLTFFNDEYGWLATSADFEPRTLLMPHNSHLIAVPRILYKAMPELLGPSHLVFAVLSVIGVLLVAGLFFVLARRRVGGLMALPPTLVLLFFGSSWDVVLATVGIPALLSLAAGLAALVALERETRRGDVAAAVLLAISLASHSTGPMFALGGAIVIALQDDRRRRIWVVAAPALLYAAWWVWALQFDQGVLSASNLPGLPRSIGESLGAGLAAVTGLNSDFGAIEPAVTQPTRFVTTYMVPLALAGAAALAIRLWIGRLTPWFWGFLAIALSYWVAVGLAEGPAREPQAARYLLMSGVVILLIAAEALRGARLGWGPLGLLFALAAISIAGNLTHLRNAHALLEAHAEDARAQLAMLELGRAHGNPQLKPAATPPSGARYVALPAWLYLAAADRVGSLAETIPELRDEPEPVREGADLILARYLGLLAAPGSGARPRGCRRVPPGNEVELSPGTTLLRAPGGGPASVRVGRFADSASVRVGDLTGSAPFSLTLPPDAAPDPWLIAADGALAVCRAR